eukprot:Clim_evm33s247 gene=Clim_evmTU33s247
MVTGVAKKTNPVGWFEIYTNDLEKARTFYESLLGVTLQSTGQKMDGFDMIMFPGGGEEEVYGASGALCRMEGIEAGGGSTVVYFTVQDCEETLNKAKELGGGVVKAKTAIPGGKGFFSLGKDTEGNVIGFYSEA